jgi:hypothetical protein
MADNQTTIPGVTPPGGGTAPGVTPNPDGVTPNGQPNPNLTQQPNNPPIDLSTLPPEVQKLIADSQKRITELNHESEDRRKKLKTYEDSQSEADKKRLADEKKFEELAATYKKEADQAKADKAKVERSLLIAKVAKNNDLSDELQEFLKGDTEAELDASAKVLAKHAKAPKAANTEGGSGHNRQAGAGGSNTYNQAGQNQGQNNQQGQQQQRRYSFQKPGEVPWPS